MKLLRFSAEGVHGFLKFNIKFRPDLTFLTGINGSGKTTAISSIVALLGPDLFTLASLSYSHISLEVEHDRGRTTISATSTADGILLHSSQAEQALLIPRYLADPDAPIAKQNEDSSGFYRELLSNRANDPVLKTIAALPKPMFLGLDRRAILDEDIARRQRFAAMRGPRQARNIFSRALTSGLSSASFLAEDRYRDALIQSGRVAEKLQRELLLNLLTSDPDELPYTLTLPTDEDVAELDRLRRDLDSISEIMRLPIVDVKSRILPLLDSLRKTAAELPRDMSVDDILTSDNSSTLTLLFSWNASQSHLRRIKLISSTVDSYNKRRAEILAQARKYQDLINGFLRDSGKYIDFSEDGSIFVRIDGVDEPRHVDLLSSGEAQMFVILSYLSFSTASTKDSVFIVDEPELSLHVQWQEMFVDSIMAANPKMQYVLATHSPSIILDKTQHCIDLSKRPRKKA